MSELPATNDLQLRQEGWHLTVTLDRPRVRNAITARMAAELRRVFDALAPRRDIRAVILRGAEGNFCAGGDVAEMAAARAAEVPPGTPDPLRANNRGFGDLLLAIDRAPQAVIAVVEGAVMGGGVGLVCASDIALCEAGAGFRLPETSLGIPPAQIAPFLVRRLGLSQARRLAVAGGRFDGRQALALGLVHQVFDGDPEPALSAALAAIGRCAPGAIAATKGLVNRAAGGDLPALLDEAADAFARAARGPEAAEGMAAFLQKRRPTWSEPEPT